MKLSIDAKVTLYAIAIGFAALIVCLFDFEIPDDSDIPTTQYLFVYNKPIKLIEPRGDNE